MLDLEAHENLRPTALTGISGSTLIRTPCGLRRAESIRVGDLIVTHDSGLQSVRVIWKTTPGASKNPSDDVAVSISKRSIRPMMPTSLLILAPAQNVLLPAYLFAKDLPGAAGLVPAYKLLGTSVGIWLEHGKNLGPFYNFCFDNHEILNASGLPIESNWPSASQMPFLDKTTRSALVRQYPSLNENCAPFRHCLYKRISCNDCTLLNLTPN
ncbi:Hint domain-containing protein [Leisingera sp. ANG59]|uniref:Hint domain-containing protein n=1 Tax=Leisingera sp. ANG59 TaxID=2675221 RepID=UPI001571C535|nr:hypothetical protein [Leisingera sp. ANG59]